MIRRDPIALAPAPEALRRDVAALMLWAAEKIDQGHARAVVRRHARARLADLRRRHAPTPKPESQPSPS